MKKTYKGYSNRNAEIKIDYEKKEIKSVYPIKKPIKYENYARHALVSHLVLIVRILTVINILRLIPLFNIMVEINAIYTLCVILIMYLTPPYLAYLFFRYLSIYLHLKSSYLRKVFPKSNARFTIRKKNWKKINLREKRFRNIVKYGRLLIINHLIYNVVVFEYSYFGKNKIKKIQTICIDNLKKKKDYKYMMIIEFEKEITEGVFKYR